MIHWPEPSNISDRGAILGRVVGSAAIIISYCCAMDYWESLVNNIHPIVVLAVNTYLMEGWVLKQTSG